MVKIAFIDDGIHPNYGQGFHISKRVDLFDADISNNSNIDSINHGTICSLVFDKYLVHKTHNIIDVRVSSPNSTTYLKDFINAIRWCIQADIDIINISLGTVNQFAFATIKQVISEAIKKGIIIVAAMDNHGIYSLPACLHGVIGVKASTIYKNGKFKFRWYPFDGIEIMTSGQHSIEIAGGKILTTKNQNSFSAPVITAYIADIFHLFGKKNYNELLLILEGKAAHRVGKHMDCSYPYFWNTTTNCESLKLWDKTLYSKVATLYLAQCNEKVPVPVVSVLGQSIVNRERFIKELTCKLKEEYTYQLISDYILQPQNNLVLPYNFDTTSFVSYVYSLFKPDVLILNIGLQYKADVYIHIDDKICMCFEDETVKSLEYPMSEMDSAVSFLYRLLQ